MKLHNTEEKHYQMLIIISGAYLKNWTVYSKTLHESKNLNESSKRNTNMSYQSSIQD